MLHSQNDVHHATIDNAPIVENVSPHRESTSNSVSVVFWRPKYRQINVFIFREMPQGRGFAIEDDILLVSPEDYFRNTN